MTRISERNRSRALWSIAAIAAGYGLFNVVAFYTMSSFGTAWFVVSLAVYGVLLVAAVTMALIDSGRPVVADDDATAEADEEPVGEPRRASGPELLEEEVLYEVPTGKLVRARFRVDGSERSLIFAITQDEVLPLDAVEDRLDAVDLGVPPVDVTGEIEAALVRRVQQAPFGGAEEDEEDERSPGEAATPTMEVTR